MAGSRAIDAIVLCCVVGFIKATTIGNMALKGGVLVIFHE